MWTTSENGVLLTKDRNSSSLSMTTKSKKAKLQKLIIIIIPGARMGYESIAHEGEDRVGY